MVSRKKITAGIMLSLSLLLGACKEPENAIQVLEVAQSAMEDEQTAVAKTGDLEIYNYLDGCVSPKVHQMKFGTQGKFGEYEVKIGERVEKDQVLATLNPTPYTENVKELQRQLEDLEANYAYEKAYNEKTMEAYGVQIEGYAAQLADEDREWGEGEKAGLAQNKSKLEEEKKRLQLVNRQLGQIYELEHTYLKAQLEEARQRVEQITIKSPCDGVVIALQDMSGMENTNESMYYAAVAEQDAYYVRCENIASSYLKGMKRICGVRNGKEYELTYVPHDSEVLREMRNNGEVVYTNFEITNPGEDIFYGDSMTVKLVSQRKEDVLYIPRNTIGHDENGDFVYKKTADGREKTYITKGSTDGICTEIKSGIEEGDIVYVQN